MDFVCTLFEVSAFPVSSRGYVSVWVYVWLGDLAVTGVHAGLLENPDCVTEEPGAEHVS